ncbi:hypothetical protein CR513_31474, partial [Mucuna pruriens]
MEKSTQGIVGSQLCGQKPNTFKPASILLPSHHQSGFFPIRVVSELSGLKGVLLARIMEGNTNRMMSLNGTNYHLWKGKMKDLLFVKKMHLPVFAAQKPESMSDEEWDFEHQ